MTWQVRRLGENDCRRILGKRWQVVGRVNGWPAHFGTRTKAEAEQIKANLKAGVGPWVGFDKHDAPHFERWEQEFTG